MRFWVVVAVLCILTFAGTLVGVMAYSGHLNRDAVRTLLGTKETAPAEEPGPDDLDIYARELRDRRAAIDEEYAQLERERRRLELVQDDLDALLEELETTLAVFGDTAPGGDADERLEETAATLAAMRGRNAARALEEWEPDQVAAVLQRMDERARAGILDAMAPDKSGPVLERLTLLNVM